MSKSCKILPLTANDRAVWDTLWTGYQTFYRVMIPDSVSATTWSRLLDPGEPASAALAWSEGAAVGLVHFIRHRSCWTVGDYCYLQDLFVAERARGAGVGRKLIEHVYVEAEKSGCARVYWLTHETNQNAMQLYDRVAQRSGFVQYRRELSTPQSKT
jgi:GNAT superfamily N-acetyltransferase